MFLRRLKIKKQSKPPCILLPATRSKVDGVCCLTCSGGFRIPKLGIPKPKKVLKRYKEFTIAQIKVSYSPNKRWFITKGNYKGEMGNLNC